METHKNTEFTSENKPQKKFDSVREYTREHDKEGRSALAQELAARRREYFEHKRSLSSVLEVLEQDVSKEKMAAEEVVAECEALEGQIAQASVTSFKKFLSFFKRRELERMLAGKKNTLEKYEENIEAMEETKSAREREFESRSALAALRSRLDAYYGDKESSWLAYEKERADRDVSGLLEKHDLFMVHGLRHLGDVGSNSPLEGLLTWEEKLRIVLALSPTISCSTIKKGDSYKNMWAGVGVLISGGTVEDAHAGDAGTRGVGLKKRTSWQARQGTAEEQIASAISDRRPDSYNEFVIAAPQASGLYFDPSDPVTKEMLKISQEAVASKARELGIPFYIARNGEFFLADQSEPVSVKEAIAGPKVSEEIQARMTSEIFEDSPFRMKPAEYDVVVGRNRGSEAYLMLHPEVFQEKIDFSKSETIIEEKYEGLRRIRYVSHPQFRSLSRERYEKREKRYVHERELAVIDGLTVARSRYEAPALSVGSISVRATSDEYVERLIENALSLRRITREASDSEGRRRWEWELHSSVSYLYGYAEAAEKHGDTEAFGKVYDIACELYPEDEYKSVLAERLDGSGKFKILPEDLE